MPLKLIPPGKRKNKYFVVRGRFLGIDVEVSTKASSPKDAAQFKAELEINLLSGAAPAAGERITFHRACDMYKAAKPHLGEQDRRSVDRLKEGIPDKMVAEVVQADIDIAAATLYPGLTPESRDRRCYSVAAAVLHYAAENKWRDWIRVRRPKKKQAETRAVSDAAVPVLVAAVSDPTKKRWEKRRLLVTWLLKQGTRISGALSVRCERIHLDAMEYELYVSKSRVWRIFPLDPEVASLLADDPDMRRGAGYLFPWRNRSSVNEWLIPLVRKLGIKFTAHMARHRVGKKLRKHGLRTIMDALGQTSPASAIRYVSSDVDAVREASKELGNVLGEFSKD